MTAALAITATGWEARLALRYARRRERTVLTSREHRGPLLVQRPFYPEPGGVCHTYLLHPPAGIVGGDSLALEVAVEPAAEVLLTTPAATKWYRSDGRGAALTQSFAVAAAASLEWLPQESLYFDGAVARSRISVDLAPGARFLGWDIACFGRPRCAERFEHGLLDLRLDVHRDGRPLLLERTRAAGKPPGLRDAQVLATFVASGADHVALEAARTVCAAAGGCLAAATLRGDLLVCRALGGLVEPLARAWHDLWRCLRPLLLGRAAVAPRIWNT